MPGNLVQSAPNGVMPASLCTAFTELRELVQRQSQYHDGTIQRSQLAQTSRRTCRLSKRLNAPLLSALYSFWVSQNAGLTPFASYNPFDVASGQQIGSNYDPTGNNTQGRMIRFSSARSRPLPRKALVPCSRSSRFLLPSRTIKGKRILWSERMSRASGDCRE